MSAVEDVLISKVSSIDMLVAVGVSFLSLLLDVSDEDGHYRPSTPRRPNSHFPASFLPWCFLHLIRRLEP